MPKKQLGQFVYYEEMEYLFAAYGILGNLNYNPRLKEIYDEAFIQKMREEFPLLFEFYGSMSYDLTYQTLEAIFDFGVENFTLKSYFDYIRKMPQEVFLTRYLQQPEERVKRLLSSEKERLDFLTENKEYIKSYYAIDMIFNRMDLLLDDLYHCAQKMKTEKALQCLEENKDLIASWKKKLEIGIQEKDLLSFSEELMGKTFHNRGPFQRFYYMPSVFFPIRCCRWFLKDQFLVLNVSGLDVDQTQQITLDQLQALSDKSRYHILLTIQEKGSISGVEIADSLGIATSTVSHHMTVLKKCGLVIEESCKATKYYSLNKASLMGCLENIKKTFHMEEKDS